MQENAADGHYVPGIICRYCSSYECICRDSTDRSSTDAAKEDEETFFFLMMGGGLLIIIFAVVAAMSTVSSSIAVAANMDVDGE